MNIESTFTNYSQFLISIAYRLLGSLSDAEDVVQSVFVELQQHKLAQVDNIQAYLAKAVTNRCLNFLKTAHKRREVYVGPWLPEPQITLASGHASAQNPLEQVIMDETISYAFLVLLERLNAVERAVFVLRESLGYSYAEIADIIQKSTANCRQIYSRAQKKLQADLPPAIPDINKHEQLTSLFLHASKTGVFDEFITMLADDAILIMDGGGKVRGALRPIIGQQRIKTLLGGIAPKGYFTGELLQVQVNGVQGILLLKNGQPAVVISFAWDKQQQQLKHMFMLSNPDKLKHIPI